MPWYLYLVSHPLGSFIGVARSESEARKHFGTLADITPLQQDEQAIKKVIELRLTGPEKVLLAI